MMIALHVEELVNIFVQLVGDTKKYLKNKFYEKNNFCLNLK